MKRLARQPYERIGQWNRILSDRRRLRRLSVSLAYIALLLPLSCGQPAPMLPEGAEPPQLLWSPPLAYPPELSEAGITGRVELEAMVDTTGRVEPGSIKVISSSRKAFEQPAIEMLSNSRFRPGHSQIGPVPMLVKFPVKFTLGREGVSRAESVAAATRVAAGVRLARQGQIPDAMVEYAGAQSLDPRLSSSAQFWYSLCWNGSVWGYAEDVMTACDHAVELEVERGSMRDGRGIARILTGDFAGAIADLQLFVGWTTNARDRLQRTAWIEQLRAGQNPLTPEVLRTLRGN